MAIQTTVSLQMLLVADDQLSTVLEAIQAQVDGLVESFSALGDAATAVTDALGGSLSDVTDEMASTTEAVDTLTESLTTTAEQAAAVGVSTEEAAAQATTAITATTEATTAAGEEFNTLDAVVTTVLARVSEQFTGLTSEMQDAIATAVGSVVSDTEEMGSVWGTTFERALSQSLDLAASLGAIPLTVADMSASLAELNAELQATAGTTSEVATNLEAGAQAATTAAEAAATQAASSAESATTGGGMPYGGMLMRGGMGAMMGYFGLNMLANAGQFYGNLQQMMAVNNMASAQAGQAMAMMGAAGVTGAAAPGFLRGMTSSLRTEFTPQIGTGMLSKNAILLQSLGITQQDVAQSPWQLLQTIGGRYRGLMGSGQGQAASQLLGLTGTQQMASLFQNWSAVQRQTTGIVPNMTAKQVQQHAQQGLTMQESMVKLSMAFDQLATSLIPLVTPLVHAFTALVDGLTGAKSPAQVLKDLGTQLKTAGGEFVALVIGLFAALKVARIFKAVPSMTVTAGVVNVTGGVPGAGTGGGAVPGETVPSEPIPGEVPPVAPESPTIWSQLTAWITDATDAVVVFASTLGGLAVTIAGITAPLWAVVAAVAAVVVGLVLLITHWKQVTAWVDHVAQALGRWTASTVLPWINQVTARLGQWAQHNQVLAGAIQLLFGPLAVLTFHFHQISQVLPQVSSSVQQWATQTLASVTHWASQSAAAIRQSVTAMIGDLDRWTFLAPLQLDQSITTLLGNLGRWTTQAPAQLNQSITRLLGSLGQWVVQAPQHLQQGLNGLTQALNQWAGGLWGSLGQSFANVSQQFSNWVNSLLKDIGLGGGGSSHPTKTSGNVGSWIQQAMHTAGVSGNQWYQGLSALVMRESSGNPNAVNHLGVNYGGGHGIEHAMGLTQMMPTTFGAYAMGGMTNILNPIDNLVASIRYITSAFGGMGQMIRSTGLMGSNYRGYAVGGMITEPIHGIGARSGSHYLFGEGGNEMITPMSGGGRTGGTGSGVNLSVTVNAMTNDPQTLAQTVANVLVQNLKRHGNFAF